MQNYINTIISKEIINTIYPVGAIFMSVNATDPSALFGGTWERIQDTFLLAAGSAYAAGSTGGASTHTHTTGNHALTINEMPAHTHGSKSLSGTLRLRDMNTGDHNVILGSTGIISNSKEDWSGSHDGSSKVSFSSYQINIATVNATHEHTSVGGGAAHNHGDTGSASNLPPYMAVYVWKRIA